MMCATGILFLGKTAPLATQATDGVFLLTLLAFDRMAPHKVEPWRITWSGAEAKTFYTAHQASLKAGQPIATTVQCMRTFTNGRFGKTEILAMATHIELAPLAHEIPALGKNPTDPMPHEIISLERLQREAKAAALQHTDINAACPYPFTTDAGRYFKERFLQERRLIDCSTLTKNTGVSA